MARFIAVSTKIEIIDAENILVALSNLIAFSEGYKRTEEGSKNANWIDLEIENVSALILDLKLERKIIIKNA